ncbi:hypothetical protein B0H13DRAFT_2441821 [Mycena leptocephala]|nr:hypothetical protein B0H13DRAFT_2441821 [Mycena leptocephala]
MDEHRRRPHQDLRRIRRPRRSMDRRRALFPLWQGWRNCSFQVSGVIVENDIDDVEVEIRDSIVTRSAGPKFLSPAFYPNATADLQKPLTTTLGLPICAQSTPWAEGTGGFFVSEGERLLLLTARHVLFPEDKENKLFAHERNSQPKQNVMLLGEAAFKKYVTSISSAITSHEIAIRVQEDFLRLQKESPQKTSLARLEATRVALDDGKQVLDDLNKLLHDVTTHWASPENRVIGHVVFSPPLSFGFGNEQYTDDWALIEMDQSKLNKNFLGNAIDLGTRISPGEFTAMMHPNIHDPPSFIYPADRLLEVTGTIPDEEMLRPAANEACIMVIKISREWAILPFDTKSGPFSDVGDSGSVVVDGQGRIGGLLTGEPQLP